MSAAWHYDCSRVFLWPLGVSTLTFILLMAMPGDLAVKVTMAQYGEDGLNQERVEKVRQETHLNRSALWLYGRWMGQDASF